MNPNKLGYKRYYPFMYIFFISVFVSLVFWDALRLPFHNPWGVSGNLVRFQFNPSNDFLRYIVFLTLPILAIITMYVINFRNSNALYFQKPMRESFDEKAAGVGIPAAMTHFFTVVFLLYTLLFALGLPTYHSTGPLDTFHEGETLGPAISYMNGLVPYKDYIFVHGIFQDPLRSVAAFALFGKSIGAVRTLESIISVFTFLLVMVFLLQVFRRQPLYVWITLFVLFNLQMKGTIDSNRVLYIPILIPPRDIMTFAFLLTLPVLQRYLGSDMEKINRFFFGITVFFFSFIPFATFGYSIDRGFYLTAAFILLYLPMYLLFFHKSPLRKYFLGASLAGTAAALMVFGIVLRGAFGAFIDFAFRKMPKYKELMDGFAFPIYDPKFLFVVLLIAANVVWVVYKLLQEYQAEGRKVLPAAAAFFQKYFVECALMFLSVFFFRSALGRSDWEHIAYSSLPAYLLALIILLKYYLHPLLTAYASRKGILYALLGILLLSTAWKGVHVLDSGTMTEKFPLQVKDEQFIPVNYQSAIRYLKKNLKADESFFTMTSEASWYYFIDKPCPTRFPVVWFAMPYFYQQEIVQDLESKNVKYILYRNNHWANAIDGFPNEEKLPIVVRYIREHYQYDSKWNDNEIWVKKDS